MISCMAHSLQLSVQYGLKVCKNLDVAIGKFRDLIKKIVDSPKLLEALASVCSTLKVRFAIPELDVETRWNSTFTMLKSAIGIRSALEELLRRIRERHDGFCNFTIDPSSNLASAIPRESWSAVMNFCSFLQPFKEATVLMSASEYSTLGMAVPVYELIAAHVRKSIAAADGFRSTHTIKFAKAVETKLVEYGSKIKSNPVQIAAALDPRVKGLLEKLGVNVVQLNHDIQAEYVTTYEDKYNDTQRRTNGGRVNANDDTANQLLSSFMDVLEGSNGELNCVALAMQNHSATSWIDGFLTHRCHSTKILETSASGLRSMNQCSQESQ
uniref:Uncharacterized protein n=1 Tax=Spongospora subterranea TaxID=70186 RepID=A0A0H5REU1_9EUKA|eukprot:CRZ12558.1 hypothetical protein [Spongospora subterranea]